MPSRKIAYLSLVILALAIIAGGTALVSKSGWLPPVPTGTGTALVGGPFTLTDHNGKTVTDASYRGNYLLVFFGFTFCPDVCPTELQVMAQALDDLGGETVAERDRSIELGQNLLEGRLQAVALDVADDAAHEIGARHRLAGERGLGEVHQLLLGASTDQRHARGNEHAAGGDAGHGNLGDLKLAAAVVLLDLLQAGNPFIA
jgi:hypothetical protein